MEGLFGDMLRLQLHLFMLMAVGYYLGKSGIMPAAAQKSLSAALINIMLPCNILSGFITAGYPDREFYGRCLVTFAVSLGIQIAASIGGRPLFCRLPKSKAAVAHFSMIVSSSSFVGLPIAEALYGSAGVIFTAIFQIPVRFTMWSAGLALFTKTSRRQILVKVFTHPCMVGCILGLLLMLLKIEVPQVIYAPIQSLGLCTTPVSMIIIGAILAETDWHMLFHADVLCFCLLRLILFPALVWCVLYCLNVDAQVMGLAVIMTAMPASSTTTVMTQQYGGDSGYAAALIFSSTLLSVFTLPLLTLFL